MIGKSIAANSFNPFTGGFVNISNPNIPQQKKLTISKIECKAEDWMHQAFSAQKFEPGKIPTIPPPQQYI